MVDPILVYVPFTEDLAAMAAAANMNAGTLKSVADLVTFFCITVISLVLIFWATPTGKTRLVRCMSIAFCGSGILHFLAFWHRDQPFHSSSVAIGSAIAMVVILTVALVIYLLKQSAGALHLAQTRKSLSLAQEQLLVEQHLMSSLVDNMPDSIYFKDKDSKFIRCNRRTAEVFGLSGPKDAVGKSDHDFFSQAEADEYRADELHIMQTGEPIINKEEYELWPDGKHHWVLSTKLPLLDAEKNIIGTFGLSRDISELKKAEAHLAAKVDELQELHGRYMQEQNLFSALIENIPDAVFFKNRNCEFIRVNPAMARDAGFKRPEDMIGLTDADVWGEDLADAALSDEQQIMTTGQPIIGKQEKVTRQSDGETRWVLATKMPLRDASNEIVGTFGLARDITTLKITQQSLAESQERFELAVMGTNDGLWDWNVETNEVWYAPRFRELLGFSADETRAFPNQLTSFRDRLHPDDRDRVTRSFDRHIEDHVPHDEEYRLKTADGEYRWFRGRGQAHWDGHGKAVRMAGSIQDIHQRHEAQAELANLQLQLQQALQGGNVGMWDWDILTNEVTVSPELMLQIGEDPEQPWVTLNDWETRLHPDDRDAAVQRTQDYIAGRTQEYESSFRLRHSDGSYLWILSRGKLFRKEDGQPRRFIGVHIDVTELRRVQEALAESEARFRGIFNQTFQFIGLLKPDGTCLDANRTSLQGAGVSPEDVIGQKFWDTVWWSHSAELQQRLQQAVKKAAAGEFDRFEATHPAPDGSFVFVDFSLKPVTDDQGEVVYLIPEGRDVTELKQYQNELKARSDDLERSNKELQQFAYVASHDLQEPLRTVVGFCRLLEMEYQNAFDETGRMYLDTIVDGGKRMQQLISDLLDYSRAGRGNSFEPVDLMDVMEQVKALLYSQIAESQAVVTFGDLPTIVGDVGQIVRLFQNLVGNAIKYRGDRTPIVKIWSERLDSEWKLFVSDNGIGIDEDFSDQVFIIFKRLHTREEYPGTGIGLAICRRIVERHGGQIRWIRSHPKQADPDHGSTFEITLPVCPSK